jgi:hypothetical protein
LVFNHAFLRVKVLLKRKTPKIFSALSLEFSICLVLKTKTTKNIYCFFQVSSFSGYVSWSSQIVKQQKYFCFDA